MLTLEVLPEVLVGGSSAENRLAAGVGTDELRGIGTGGRRGNLQ